MPIPQEILKKLEKYPAAIDSLKPVYDKPSLPEGYEPKIVDIYCDMKHGIQWVQGYLTHQIEVPKDYEADIIEWAIDGEIVAIMLKVLIENETVYDTIFSRLEENVIKMPDLNNSPKKEG